MIVPTAPGLGGDGDGGDDPRRPPKGGWIPPKDVVDIEDDEEEEEELDLRRASCFQFLSQRTHHASFLTRKSPGEEAYLTYVNRIV